MSFESLPKKLTVPEEDYYPVDRLHLFEKHDRESWERAFGEQAPKWDPSRPEKRWADTSVLAGVSDPVNSFVDYTHFNMATRKFESLRLTVREAATPNLSGSFVYPKHMISPTSAVMVNPDGIEEPLNPKFLCYKSEAEALAGELGVNVVAESGAFSDGPYTIDWRNENRRMWLIKIGGDYHGAALLLAAKHKYGVGAPGSWQLLDGGQPVWIKGSEPTGEQDSRPEVPVPCRELAGNEAFYFDPFRTIVYRTDRQSLFNQTNGEAGGGQTSIPADLRATIERIDATLQQLLAIQVMN